MAAPQARRVPSGGVPRNSSLVMFREEIIYERRNVKSNKHNFAHKRFCTRHGEGRACYERGDCAYTFFSIISTV